MALVRSSTISHWHFVWKRLYAIPLAFFGVGTYRAWLAIFFRYNAYPGIGTFDYFIFEGAIGVVSLVLALVATRITPLWSNKKATVFTWLAMTIGSAVLAIASFITQSQYAVWAGLVLSGGGLASLILMWAEFYGSLNPMRVALYHAIALFLGECIKWIFMGMSAPYLVFFSLILPSISIVQVKLSMHAIPELDLPAKPHEDSKKPFPWKPILLMSTCTFSGGFGGIPGQQLLIGNVTGTVFVTALVAVGVLSRAKWFNFDTIYQLAFPFITVGFMLLPATFDLSGQVRAFCYDAGYSMLSMFIMLIMSNITYRFGISAVWLNGIERGVRYVVEVLGWLTGYTLVRSASPQTTQAVVLIITIILSIVFIAVFHSERNLSARWGIRLEDIDDQRKKERELTVSDLSKKRGLTPREEEVFQLVMRGDSIQRISEELFVSQGTVKAHINHIYRKLGIHSRQEMLDLVEK